LIASSLAGFVTISITLPFYLNDPAAFAPLGSSNKLKYWNHMLPWASTALIGTTLIASLFASIWLLVRRTRDPVVAFFRCCTIVTLAPMIGAILVSS
jgi:hypothetical protein